MNRIPREKFAHAVAEELKAVLGSRYNVEVIEHNSVRDRVYVSRSDGPLRHKVWRLPYPEAMEIICGKPLEATDET